jgi:peptidoglycan hydrolase-like protein with peptidoglycan-binding domain
MNVQLAAAGFLGALAGLAVALPLGGIAAPVAAKAVVSAPAAQSGPQLGAILTVSPSGVRVVKQALNRLGYSAGPVTGAWNRQVSQAILEFQEAHVLEATGTMTVSTIAALGLWNRIIGDPLGNGRKPVERRQDIYGPAENETDGSARSTVNPLPSQRVTNEVPGGGAQAAVSPVGSALPKGRTGRHRAHHRH